MRDLLSQRLGDPTSTTTTSFSSLISHTTSSRRLHCFAWRICHPELLRLMEAITAANLHDTAGGRTRCWRSGAGSWACREVTFSTHITRWQLTAAIPYRGLETWELEALILTGRVRKRMYSGRPRDIHGRLDIYREIRYLRIWHLGNLSASSLREVCQWRIAESSASPGDHGFVVTILLLAPQLAKYQALW